MNEEPVEYANEEQAFDNPENIAGKMIITPDITSIFACKLFVLSLCRATYHLFIMPPILPCQASNPPS